MRFILKQFKGWSFRDTLLNVFASLIIVMILLGLIKAMGV